MKKRRLFVIFSIMIILVMFFLLSSPIFRLNGVYVAFYDKDYNEISLSKNSVYTTQKSVENIIERGNFDYNSLIFFIHKKDYSKNIEEALPYIKVLSIVTLFPNKIRLNLQEREEKLFIVSPEGYCVLDKDFKLLRHTTDEPHLLPLVFVSERGSEVSLFDFFEISSQAFSDGTFLSDNNHVFQSMENMFYILENMDTTFGSFIQYISIQKDTENVVTLTIRSTSPYGVRLIVEDVMCDFEYKLQKILSALNTLYFRENIKTTHGTLLVNSSKNVSWRE